VKKSSFTESGVGPFWTKKEVKESAQKGLRDLKKIGKEQRWRQLGQMQLRTAS